MKKRFLLVGIVAILGLGVFAVSCSKDDDKKEEISCTCWEDETPKDTQKINPESFGAKNCSDLAMKLNMSTDADDMTWVVCR